MRGGSRSGIWRPIKSPYPKQQNISFEGETEHTYFSLDENGDGFDEFLGKVNEMSDLRELPDAISVEAYVRRAHEERALAVQAAMAGVASQIKLLFSSPEVGSRFVDKRV